MLSGSDKWAIGVGMALSNCALSALGFTLQRKYHLLNQKDLVDRQVSPDQNESGPAERTCQLMWVIGVILYISAAVPDVVSYTMVPQVVCSTMQCLRLVLVTVLAHFFLNEHLQRREFVGMTSCVIGTFLCLAYGPKLSDEERLAEAGDLYHPQVYSYVMVVIALLLCLLLLEHSDAFGLSLPSTAHYLILPITTGLAFGIEKVFNTEIGFLHLPDDLPAGLLKQPQWMAMAAAIGALGLTDLYLNLRGARSMPVQAFVPAAFAFGTALQFLQSVFVFGELKEMDTKDAVLSMIGACASLAGAVGLQPPQLQQSGIHKHEFALVSQEEFSSEENDAAPCKQQLVSVIEMP